MGLSERVAGLAETTQWLSPSSRSLHRRTPSAPPVLPSAPPALAEVSSTRATLPVPRPGLLETAPPPSPPSTWQCLDSFTSSASIAAVDHSTPMLAPAPPMSTAVAKVGRHARRASAPADFGAMLTALRLATPRGEVESPRSVVQSRDASKDGAKDVLTGLRSWWESRKRPAANSTTSSSTMALPTMPFLEEAFEEQRESSEGAILM
jgi:hypothetical protein